MSKTDKELTTEIVIAAINANPKLAYGNAGLSAPLDHSHIQSLIKSTYTTLQELDNPTK